MKQTYNVNIEGHEALPTPEKIKKELPITSAISENVYRYRKTIEAILSGKDKRTMVITGPCSIDHIGAALEYAEKLSKLSEEVSDRFFVIMRAYFDLPRTTVGWKGMIYDPCIDDSCRIEKGIRLARKFLLDLAGMGTPAATEMLEPVIPQYIADLISWAAIGARTTESQTHRQMASGLSMPTGFKNTTDGDIKVAIEAIKTAASKHTFLGVTDKGQMAFFKTKGNKFCHLVLRGGDTGPNYGSEYIAFARELMKKMNINPAIIIDCSHGNSFKKAEGQSIAFMDAINQISKSEMSIRGLMLESYLKHGKQESGKGKKIVPGLSITDACISWDETETLIRDAYSKIKI